MRVTHHGTGARTRGGTTDGHSAQQHPYNHQHWALDFTETLHGAGHHTGNIAGIYFLRQMVSRHLSLV